jgi:hypothetical protein
LDRGCLPIGTLNFVEVHNADDLFCFVLNFLVAMSHKLGEDHAAARQELFDCDLLFHIPFWLTTRQTTPQSSPLVITTISPSLTPSTLNRRVKWPANIW